MSEKESVDTGDNTGGESIKSKAGGLFSEALTLACRSLGHLWGFCWVAAEPGHRAVPLQDPVLRLETLTRNTEEGLLRKALFKKENDNSEQPVHQENESEINESFVFSGEPTSGEGKINSSTGCQALYLKTEK